MMTHDNNIKFPEVNVVHVDGVLPFNPALLKDVSIQSAILVTPPPLMELF